MRSMSIRCVKTTTAVAALALIAAAGQAQDKTFIGGDGQWNVAANWDPAGVPGAGHDVYINNGSVARLSGPYHAFANNLTLGWHRSTGSMFVYDGRITVSDYIEVGGPDPTGQGYLEVTGTGQLITRRLMVGRTAGDSTMWFTSSREMRVDDDAYIGGNAKGNFNHRNGIVQIKRDLYLGLSAGGDGTWSVSNAATAVERDVYVGYHANGKGKLELGTSGNFGLGGTMYVGQFGASAPNHGVVTTVAGSRFYDFNPAAPNAKIIVQGTNGRMTGEGRFDVGVRYESDRNFGGGGDKSVSVEFKPGVMRRASVMNVAPGLSNRTGPANARTAVTNRSLPGTTNAVSWGDAAYAPSVNYFNNVNTPANNITVEVPYRQADIPAGGAIPAANLQGRLRLAQIGARRWNAANAEQSNTQQQIVNITSAIAADKITGKTTDVFGSWDTAIIGNPVVAQHQDPNIRTLHTMRTNPLSGAGVVMGQLEPGLPDSAHGAFEDWTRAAGRRLSYSGAAPAAGASSGHATRVASIMIGHDPLGLQVTGQGHLVPAARGYGPGGSQSAGFVGAAPGATLVSRNWTNETGSATDITTIAGLPNMKIVNMSAGFSQSNPVNPRPTGDNLHERAIDRMVETNGIIWTKSAGNDGTLFGGYQNMSMPAGTYNGIVVGAVEFDRGVGGTPNDGQFNPRNFNIANASLATFSSRGPTNPNSAGAQRSKPDIVAQGVGNLAAIQYERHNGTHFIIDPIFGENGGRGLYSTEQRVNHTAQRANPGTSFAAPTVAGVAALMVEDARRMRNAAAEDPRIVKSILQTTADKPAGWSKGRAGNGDDSSRIPLSFDWGAGLLDPVGAINLLRAGTPANFGNIKGDGWARSTIAAADVTTYAGRTGPLSGDGFLFKSVQANQGITLTLNWYSHVNAAMTTRTALSNIFLELYMRDAATRQWLPVPGSLSDSRVDNLQHIFMPTLPINGAVLARVHLGGAGLGALANETYGLSWQYTLIPAPGTAALLGMAGLIAARRRRA